MSIDGVFSISAGCETATGSGFIPVSSDFLQCPQIITPSSVSFQHYDLTRVACIATHERVSKTAFVMRRMVSGESKTLFAVRSFCCSKKQVDSINLFMLKSDVSEHQSSPRFFDVGQNAGYCVVYGNMVTRKSTTRPCSWLSGFRSKMSATAITHSALSRSYHRLTGKPAFVGTHFALSAAKWLSVPVQ